MGLRQGLAVLCVAAVPRSGTGGQRVRWESECHKYQTRKRTPGTSDGLVPDCQGSVEYVHIERDRSKSRASGTFSGHAKEPHYNQCITPSVERPIWSESLEDVQF